jgi:hypothetical protein
MRMAAGVVSLAWMAGCGSGSGGASVVVTDDVLVPGEVDEEPDLAAGGEDADPLRPDPGVVEDLGVMEDPGVAGDPGPEVDPTTLPKFSFFVTSLKALRELSGSPSGFGGDLRFGETGPGAGLRGADKLCATIAERSMPGSSVKSWRAYLSVTADENGVQVNAIDRIGNGPWYDRMGRTFAPSKADLLFDRPRNGSALIRNDFPNEDGVLNHQPDPTQAKVDNHDMLTGSNAQGKLYSATATCKDWTTSDGSKANGKPRVGHSWPTAGGGPGGAAAAPGGPGGQDMANWMSALDEAGCAAGVNLIESGGAPPGATTVGAGGGYGGFHCFALVP